VRSVHHRNFREWLDEYHVDGFRWDSVGAMRYYDPGHVNIPEADSLIQYIKLHRNPSDHPGAISIARINIGNEFLMGNGTAVLATHLS